MNKDYPFAKHLFKRLIEENTETLIEIFRQRFFLILLQIIHLIVPTNYLIEENKQIVLYTRLKLLFKFSLSIFIFLLIFDRISIL